MLRRAVFSWLGIKDQSRNGDIAPDDLNKIEQAGLPRHSFTRQEKEAWLKAGMPNLTEFLRKYRKDKRCRAK